MAAGCVASDLIHTARAVSRESTSSRIDRRMYVCASFNYATGTARGELGKHGGS